MAEVKTSLISLGVKLKILAYSPLALYRSLKYFLTIASTPGPRRPWKRTIAVAISRALSFTIGPLTGITPKDLPQTGDAVRGYCVANNLDLRSVTIPIAIGLGVPPAGLHFVTPKQAANAGPSRKKRVLFYFHGGGYRFPLPGDSHMDFALRVAVAANVSSLAILEYGLAPGLQHPGQLVQAVEALRHLLRSTGGGHTGYAAKDIFLFGDSAGGNLVAGVLAHLKYTSPYTQAIELSDHLGGAVMLSPWVSMRHDGDSYISNVTMDTIDVAGGLESKEKWKPKVGDRFADMLCETNAINIGPDNVKGFWTGVFQGGKRVVDKALILAGGDEIILDDVMAFGKIAGAAERLAGRAESAGDDGSVVLLHCPGETHCGAILDVIAGVEVEGGMLAGIIKWLSKIRCE